MSVLVRLMGTFSVEVDGRIVDQGDFQRRSAAAVVKMLALAPRRRMHREQIMDSLWPTLPLHDAANQLHKAAHYARRATGAADCVTLRNEMVTLFDARIVTVDVHSFESSASAALANDGPQAVDAALIAWTGDLLPDDLYASWTFQPRQRADLLHRELLRRAGRWAELVTVDSTDEEAHLGVAQGLLIAGDRSGAVRQLDLLEQMLRDELGIGPSPEAYDLRVQVLDTPVTRRSHRNLQRPGTPDSPSRWCTSAARRMASDSPTPPVERGRRWSRRPTG